MGVDLCTFPSCFIFPALRVHQIVIPRIAVKSPLVEDHMGLPSTRIFRACSTVRRKGSDKEENDSWFSRCALSWFLCTALRSTPETRRERIQYQDDSLSLLTWSSSSRGYNQRRFAPDVNKAEARQMLAQESQPGSYAEKRIPPMDELSYKKMNGRAKDKTNPLLSYLSIPLCPVVRRMNLLAYGNVVKGKLGTSTLSQIQIPTYEGRFLTGSLFSVSLGVGKKGLQAQSMALWFQNKD